MQQIGIWHVTEQGPKRLETTEIDLEQYLEEWIEEDPGLLQHGLTIVGRQFGVEAGRMDLLALDPQGRWVVIEIKRGGRVRRETIAQALDYASCIATMGQDELYQKVGEYLQAHGGSIGELFKERDGQNDEQGEPREVMTYVVGTGSAPGLERMIDYLGGVHGVPIALVSYEVLEIKDGQRILVRELTEPEISLPTTEEHRLMAEDVCAVAEDAGIGSVFRMILDAARSHGLYARPYKRSIMYAPPVNRTRALFTIQAEPKADRLIRAWVGSKVFAEFYPVTEEAAISIIGEQG